MRLLLLGLSILVLSLGTALAAPSSTTEASDDVSVLADEGGTCDLTRDVDASEDTEQDVEDEEGLTEEERVEMACTPRLQRCNSRSTCCAPYQCRYYAPGKGICA